MTSAAIWPRCWNTSRIAIPKRNPLSRYRYFAVDDRGRKTLLEALHAGNVLDRFAVPDAADYSLASGVFNIKLDWPLRNGKPTSSRS